jgi:hypothetical protein
MSRRPITPRIARGLAAVTAVAALGAAPVTWALPAQADVATTTLKVNVYNETTCCGSVNGATVTLISALTGSPVGAAATTDATGEVQFSVPAGAYTAKVAKTGFVTEYSPVTTVSPDDVTNSNTENAYVGLNISSSQMGKVHGRFTVNGGTSTWWNGFGYIDAFDATSGDQMDGTWINQNLDGQWGRKFPAGSYKFAAEVYSYNTGSWSMIWIGGSDQASAGVYTVTAGGTTEVPTVDLSQAATNPTRVTGKVTDASGRGLDNVAAYLVPSSAPYGSSYIAQASTDRNGTYEFTGAIPAADYRIWFRDYDDEFVTSYYAGTAAPVPAPNDGTVPAGAATVTVGTTLATVSTVKLVKGTAPTPTSGVTGTVTDDAGVGLTYAHLYLANDETQNSRSITTSRDGAWRVSAEELPPGTYSAYVYDDDDTHDQLGPITVTIPVSGVGSAGTMKLIRRGVVKGSLSHVGLSEDVYTSGLMALYSADGDMVDTEWSDDLGRFEFDPVSPGKYYLQATEASSYGLYDNGHDLIPAFYGGGSTLATATPITVTRAGTTTANITLTNRLTGRGVAISGTPGAGRILTARTGSWNRSLGTSYSFVWKSGSTVVGKTASYKVAPADAGKTITLTVTAKNPIWETGTASASIKVTISAAQAKVNAAQAKVDATNAAIAKADASLKAAKKAHNKAGIAKAKSKLAGLKKKLKKQKADLARAKNAAK